MERMSNDPLTRFRDVTYETFRSLAADGSLSPQEKIGFPDAYRDGLDDVILADIRAKVPALDRAGALVVDIGIGCGSLALALIEHARAHALSLVAVDSREMLDVLPTHPGLRKEAGFYPRDLLALTEELRGKVDAIVCYSVFHYVFRETSATEFLDRALSMLAPGGVMLVGDIPNVSQRNRFFSSAAGVAYHQKFTQTDTQPTTQFNALDVGAIDDGILLGLVARYRHAGYDAYVVAQQPELPMANRREDLLFRRP